MALDPKIIAVGALLGFLFLGKKPAKSNATTGTKTEDSDDGKGDLNDPSGPNGCKEGLTVKNGICIADPNKPDTGSGNGNGGKLSKSDLSISKDCKSFSFGDKTGDAWWKVKGEKNTKQWVSSGETDSLEISFQMVKKTGSCFKDFPVKENFPNWFEFNLAKYQWIQSNRAMWTLLYSIRNRIDTTQFNGVETVTADPYAMNLDLKFGKGFNYDKFWEMLKPMALTLLQLEAKNPGSVLNLKKPYDDGTSIIVIVTTWLFMMIFPNVPYNDMMTRFYKGTIGDIPLWSKLWDSVSEFDGASIDLESEGF